MVVGAVVLLDVRYPFFEGSVVVEVSTGNQLFGEVLFQFASIGYLTRKLGGSSLAQDVQLILKVLRIVGDTVEIWVLVKNVHIAPGERDQIPKVKVNETASIEEEFSVSNIMVDEPVAISLVLDLKRCGVVEPTTGNGLFRPLVDLGVEKSVGLGSVRAKGFIEGGKVRGLALACAGRGDVGADCRGSLVLKVEADRELNNLFHTSSIEDRLEANSRVLKDKGRGGGTGRNEDLLFGVDLKVDGPICAKLNTHGNRGRPSVVQKNLTDTLANKDLEIRPLVVGKKPLTSGV